MGGRDWNSFAFHVPCFSLLATRYSFFDMYLSDMSHRVVITGTGWVTPLGDDIESCWSRLLRGESGVRPTTHFDAQTFPSQFSAEVKDFQLSRFVDIDSSKVEHMRPNSRFLLGAAAQAWKQAKLDDLSERQRQRVGIYVGCGEGTLDFNAFMANLCAAWSAQDQELDMHKWVAAAATQMHAKRELEQEPNMPAAHVAAYFGIYGPAFNCLTACAASTQAIGEATQLVRRGEVDLVVSGGAHSMIHPLGVTGFNRLTALSQRNDDPSGASRPFDRKRDGFVLGEGAGVVILESLEMAQRRGVPILAEVVGYGSSADAFRITDTHPEGRGAVVSMEQALQDAELTVADIDYISAHGTGTKENDSTETLAIKKMFGERADRVPISSIKSMMGHLIAAAGVVELITCVLAIRDRKIPPTVNYQNEDPECDLDYVPNRARNHQVDVALSNSFGFGGQNDTLIVRKWSE